MYLPQIKLLSLQIVRLPTSRSREAMGARPPLPPRFFFKIMQFSGNFKGKPPILSKCWAQGPSLGSKQHRAPLTKILDLCLLGSHVPAAAAFAEESFSMLMNVRKGLRIHMKRLVLRIPSLDGPTLRCLCYEQSENTKGIFKNENFSLFCQRHAL